MTPAKESIAIGNFDNLIVDTKQVGKNCLDRKKHGEFLPSSARILICGASNCGKTNVLLNLIVDKNGLKFKNRYLFSKSLYQEKYKLLDIVFSKLKCVNYYKSDNIECIPQPNDIDTHSLIIFDDLNVTRVPQIRNFFTMGRHKSIDCVYLIQSYGAISKHHIRDNANMLIIFKMDMHNLKLIFRDFVGTDMTFVAFRNLCSHVWQSGGNHSFISIFTECTPDAGKYRNCLGMYIDPSVYSSSSTTN